MSDLMTAFGQGTAEVGMAQAKGDKNASTAQPETSASKISASQVRTLWDEGSRQLLTVRRQYWINKAAIEGDQWVWWNKEHMRVEQMSPSDRVRATVNKLGPAARDLRAKTCEREIVFEVVPEDADDPAVRRASIGESVLADLKRRHNFELLRANEFDVRFQGGTSLIAIDWDGAAGVEVGESEDGDKVGTGDLRYQVLSVAEAVTEAGSRDMEHARWWIKAVTLPPKDVQAMFDLPECPAADSNAALGPYQSAAIAGSDNTSRVPMTLVMTYYERPNRLCSAGQVAVVVGNKVVKWAKWPFPFKNKLNVVVSRETKDHTKWYGSTILSSAQPVQQGINAAWSSILEHLKQVSNARLAVPDTSIDSIDQLSDNPGELFTYNPAGPPPSYMAPPNMPAWWVQMPTALDAAMQDILSRHDAQSGIAPGNLESGLGLSILTEQDDGPLREMVKETKGAFERLGTMTLEILSAEVSETRKAKVSMDAQSPRVVAWSGKDLKDCGDVIVPLDEVMPSSEAAAHARAQALWDRHIITDPKQYAKIARLPMTKDLMSALDPDVSKAGRENLSLADGVAVIPADFDDHAKHIAAHNDYRKSEAYDRLDSSVTVQIADPATGESRFVSLQQLVDLHVQAHETLASQAAGTQLAQQMAHPALGQSPNANGQQPVIDGGDPLPGNPVTAIPGPPPNVNPGGAPAPAQPPAAPPVQ